MTPSAQMIDDVEVIDADREQITLAELRQMMRWGFGDEGAELADLWASLNDRLWDGQLDPVPLWLPRCTTYGAWIGLCTSNTKGQVLHLQVKYQLGRQARADVLLHEMVHQCLVQTGQKSNHNAWPWCEEIRRLTSDIWGIDIWASPAVPRKVDGRSKRVQRPGPDGQQSITRRQIATWPSSIGRRLPLDEYLTNEVGRW